MRNLVNLLLIPSLLFYFACAEKNNTEETSNSQSETSSLQEETSQQKAERMNWWQEARFGMFIHWGLYAIPAGEHNGQRIKEKNAEWIMHFLGIPVEEYETYASQFNPEKFNAEEWVALAKEAGMKYIVITSKHHDGFSLWDSKVSGYDVVDSSPYGKDLLKQLADACQKEGIKLCFYYSIMDWHHPDAQAAFAPNYNQGHGSNQTNPNFPNYLENYMKPQLKELLTDYGDIGVLWFDGEWIPDYTSEMGKDIYQYIRGIKPDLIVNNRVDKGRKGMEGLTAEGNFAGDFGTPEQEIPATGLPGVDWESCMTMNDSWGYKSFDDNWKSEETLIRNLVDIVSKGGNFLLNVGPTAEGLIPQESVSRLKAMGTWMNINKEAIYGAQASPFEMPEWGRYTQKNGTIYAHVFNWPGDGKLAIPELEKVSQAYFLYDREQTPIEVEVSENGEGIVLSLPSGAPDPVASVIVLKP